MTATNQQYKEVVKEIHLAVESGDDTALQGISGMLVKRAELEQALQIDPKKAKAIHDDVAR